MFVGNYCDDHFTITERLESDALGGIPPIMRQLVIVCAHEGYQITDDGGPRWFSFMLLGIIMVHISHVGI